MKKIYVAGCGGMLGEAIHRQFKDDFILRCTDKDVNEDWLSYLDFRDFEAYKKDVENFNPDYLFHIGAHTDLEYCEENPEDAYMTNTLSVEHAVYIANRLNIPLVYISTAGIFDGKKEFYDDWDIPNPLGIYARTKYLGERFVVENSKKYLICRPGWMMGGGPRKDKKFIGLIINQIKRGKKELLVVNDKEGVPTYTNDFAKNLKILLKKEFWGIYNMVCSGETSRLEITKELLRILDLQDQIKIISVDSDYFKKNFKDKYYFAERPSSEKLINKKLELRGLNLMRDWREALREYINLYYKGYLDTQK